VDKKKHETLDRRKPSPQGTGHFLTARLIFGGYSQPSKTSCANENKAIFNG
jgi:hypothetical protein